MILSEKSATFRDHALARSALVWLALFALPPAGAVAAPIVSGIDELAAAKGSADPVFDDGGWRRRDSMCCRGRSEAGILGRGSAPRLGDRDRYYDRPTYGDRSTDEGDGSSFDDDGDLSIYRRQLEAPLVYQRDSLGGGYFGDPR